MKIIKNIIALCTLFVFQAHSADDSSKELSYQARVVLRHDQMHDAIGRVTKNKKQSLSFAALSAKAEAVISPLRVRPRLAQQLQFPDLYSTFDHFAGFSEAMKFSKEVEESIALQMKLMSECTALNKSEFPNMYSAFRDFAARVELSTYSNEVIEYMYLQIGQMRDCIFLKQIYHQKSPKNGEECATFRRNIADIDAYVSYLSDMSTWMRERFDLI
ncbi:MAG: hypothetical protein OXC30_05400 [Alphaproteobacteria bacterium]|nr:hypothetical protein [Alphaproteobacteria bacterium]